MILTWFILAQVIILKAQDANFTQYFNTPTFYNPAFTGINPGLTVRSIFRNQLPRQTFGYQTFSFSADLGEPNLPGFGGVGILVNSDDFGTGLIHEMSLGLGLSARIRFGEYVSAQIGVRASVVQKHINWNDVVFTDQLGTLYGKLYPYYFNPPEDDKKVYPDFGTGILIQYAGQNSRVNGTVGFAVDHLFTPDQSFFPDYSSPLPRKFVVHADFEFAIGKQSDIQHAPKGMNDPLKLSPGILFQNQGSLNQLQAGFNIQKFNFTIGGWYKTMFDSPKASYIAVIAGYRFMFGKELSIHIMYNHDFRIPPTKYGPGEPNEISLIFRFGKVQVFGKRGKDVTQDT